LNGLFCEINKRRVIPPCQFANSSGREDGLSPAVTERLNVIYELLGKPGICEMFVDRKTSCCAEIDISVHK
jgi:hypothetical protein